MKNLRILAALFLAFGSLLFVTPAHAQTLEEAQAALAAGQQELIDATQALSDATAALDAATVTLAEAQAAYDDAHAAKLATAVEHPAVTTTSPETNVVVNGTFDSTQGWTNVVASSTVYTGGASPIIYNGTLKGSYSAGYYIQQTGTFATPTRQVTFAVDVFNYDTNEGNRVNNPDYYRIEFRTYNAAGTRLNYYNLEVNQWHNSWITRGATYTLPDDAVRWDIGFRMADGGYWAGAFGPVMDNVKLLTASTTTTPAYTTYGEAETQAEINAQTALTAAQSAYSLAASNKSAAQNRYDAAVLAIPALEQAVTALTPVTPPWWAQENGEGETVTITAPQGWEFYSVRAWYGSPTDDSCGQDVSSVLGPLMIGQHSVTVTLDNGTFGDPCGGVVKVTRLTWSIVASQPVVQPEPTPEPSPTQTIEPTPTPTVDPQTPVVVEPTPTPTPTPEPEPTPTITPTPEPGPSPTPTPEPTPTPTPTPEPTPEPTPTPTEEPTPTPTPEETVVPTPEPTLPPKEEPAPTPEETQEPVVEPVPNEPEPTPEPEPSSPVEESSALIEDLTKVEDPKDLTEAQVEQLVEAAHTVLETAEQGSPEYEAALEALAVAAQADDPELPAELAAIPLLGETLGAALELFNDLGNFGADMAPAVREQAEKVVVSAIIVTQVATSAAVSAAVASASSVSTRKTN